ncbi:MAG: DUF3368 domain-containing protein [Thauera sp.]|nr:DUF3368 domain-containing protein [Thauera sp.]
MPISVEASCIVVADAGPLIALGRIDALDLLPKLFARIDVTETVIAECLTQPDLPDARRIAAALSSGWLMPCPDLLDLVDGNIHPGEASTIARALQNGIDLLMDDRVAVAFARQLGLKVIGTLGILILAKRRGHIVHVAPLVERLRTGGHYLGTAAVLTALEVAGEEPED